MQQPGMKPTELKMLKMDRFSCAKMLCKKLNVVVWVPYIKVYLMQEKFETSSGWLRLWHVAISMPGGEWTVLAVTNSFVMRDVSNWWSITQVYICHNKPQDFNQYHQLWIQSANNDTSVINSTEQSHYHNQCNWCLCEIT